jgi:S-DNA-T family DNA segregation ATPase FtsK/SpoIIIE
MSSVRRSSRSGAAPSRSGQGPARTRGARAGRRSARGGSEALLDPFSPAAAFLFRASTLGLLLVVLVAALAAVLLLDVPAAAAYTEPATRALGVGVFLVLALVAALGGAVFLRRFPRPSRRNAARVAGAALLAVVLWGIAGWFVPDRRLGGAALAEVTLGGDVGRFLGRTPPGILLMLLAFAGACALLWPSGSRRALARIPPAARTVWGWRVPHRIARTAVEGFRALFVTGESTIGATAGDPPPDEADPSPPRPRPLPARPTGAGRERVAATEDVVALRDDPPTGGGDGVWPRPPRDLLLAAPPPEAAAQDNAARARLIVDTLASFGVAAKVVSIHQGPTVTQFGIEPGWEIRTRTVVEKDAAGRPVLDRDGRPKTRTEEVSRTRVRVNQITGLANDLALALAAPSIRIEAPVPGRPVVGIEVPNTNAAVVTLRHVLETPAFQRMAARSKLAIALGQDVSGEVVVADLARMPHLLIAGATGAGKSVCINSLIACILMHASPDEVRFVMIDPKRVELIGYEPIPHLALSKVIVDMEDVVGTLGAVIHEMDARYRRFAAMAVRNLEAYNRHPGVVEKLPQWVVIIDELADLMMAAPYEVEKQICRLAQLARATGIHLVIATQRPSVDVITGLIKANFPTRIAFAVTSQVDSRTILDGAGAEKLLGRGDMLYLATDAAKPRRIQGVYVSDQEIERLVSFWANERFAPYRPPTFDHLLEQARAEAEKHEEEDPLLERARELALEHSRVSTSMLQRRLRIGYPRAARLMDLLEAEGLVGAAEGAGSHPVLGDRDV